VSAGTTETEVKYARINTAGGGMGLSKLRTVVSLWSSSASYEAQARIYIDDEATPRLTLRTTSTSETLLSDVIDISGLSPGIHIVRLKLYSTGGTAYNELWEIWGVT